MTTKYDKAVSVCFSGHRAIPSHMQKAVRRQVRKEIERAYKRGIRNFYCGMALGFDTQAAIAALSLQSEYQDLMVIAVVPFRGQADRWGEKERERYQNILGIMNEVIVLSEEYHPGCLLRRNDWMLEHSSGVIAYFDGQQRGGTYYTCRRARLLGLPITNLYDNT